MVAKGHYFACIVVVMGSAILCRGEFQVNTHTTGDQFYPAVAGDAQGNFIVVWRSDWNDGRGGGIYGRRFDANGSALGGEFKVSVSNIDLHVSAGPSVAMHPSGRFVVVWDKQDGNGDPDVVARLYDANATPLTGEFQVSTYNTGAQWHSRVAMNENGDFVVVWQCWYGSEHVGYYYSMGRVFDSSGVPAGIEFIMTQLVHSLYPDVVIDNSGDFVAAWVRESGGGTSPPPFGEYVRFRRYNADGTAKGDVVQITGDLEGYYNTARIAMDASGDFIITWTKGSWPELDIYAQPFSASGAALSAPFLVNTYTADIEWQPSLAMNGAGKFVIVWESLSEDYSEANVFGRRYNSTGSPIGENFQLNAYTPGRQWDADVALNDSGQFMVVWESEGQDGSEYGIFGTFGVFPEPPLEVMLQFTPQSLNPDSQGKWVKAHIVLPEGFQISDVDVNSPLVLEPGNITGEYVKVFLNDTGCVEVEAGFARGAFCAAGVVDGEVTVTGWLVSGRCFYGVDSIRVIDRRIEAVAVLAMHWLEECAGPDWCDGSDVNGDGVVDFADFVLVGGCCVESDGS